MRETERITLEVKQIPPMRVGSPPLINIISWPPCFVLCLMDAHSSRADCFIIRKKNQASSFELKEEEILRSDPLRLQPSALGVRLELFDHPCRVSSHQPCFKRHKTRVSTIHKQYTDLINTSPTYLFLSA